MTKEELATMSLEVYTIANDPFNRLNRQQMDSLLRASNALKEFSEIDIDNVTHKYRVDELERLNESLEDTIQIIMMENDVLRNKSDDEKIIDLQKQIADLNFLTKVQLEGGRFYHAIQGAIKDDEVLQDAWAQFILTMQLRVENQIPGLTCPRKV